MYSIEFQREVLYLLSTNIKFALNFGLNLKPDYFDTQPLRILFALISTHIIEYNKEIDLKDLLIKIDDYIMKKGYSNDVYKNLSSEAKSLFNIHIKSEQFVIDEVVKFCCRQELKVAVLQSIDIIEKGGDPEKVLRLIDKAVSVGAGRFEGATFDSLMDLPNTLKIKYNPSQLVKTGFSRYDRSLMGGMASPEIHVVQAPPKCLVGSTLVQLLDGTEIPISDFEHLKEKYVLSYDLYTNKIIPALARYSGKRIADDIVEITLDNNYKIQCTSDHKWLLSNGLYKEAKDLIQGDSLMSSYWVHRKANRVKIKSSWEWREKASKNCITRSTGPNLPRRLPLQNHKVTSVEHILGDYEVFDIEVPGLNNFSIAAGFGKSRNGKPVKTGVFIHNSGKSTLGSNIGAYNIVAGKAVFHSTHELKEIDVLAKYAVRLTGMTYTELINCDMDDYLKRLQKFLQYKPNLFVKDWVDGGASTLNIRSWVSRERAKTGVEPGLIIIDYDDCLVPCKGLTGDMYEDAGNIYSDIISLSDYFNCFVGDTLIHTSEGNREIGSIDEGEVVKVLSKDKDGNITETLGYGLGELGKTSELIELEFDDGCIVRCTKDHKFLLESGVYKEAQDLTEDDIIASVSNE